MPGRERLPLRAIGIAAGAIAAAVLLSVIASLLLVRHFGQPLRGQPRLAQQVEAIPGPRLESAPQPALARYRAEKQPPKLTLSQQLGARLPLDLPLTDADGQPHRLGDFFHDARPVLMVLGYYRCPQLCGLLMHGLLDALAQGAVAPSGYRLVAVSVDPEDTPATARARRQVYRDYARFDGLAPQMHLLVGDARDTAALAQRLGFGYARTDGAARFAHPAGVIVLTPDGVVSRYLMGVPFDAQELRVALADASQARIGRLADRLALLCAHVDLRLGRHSGAVMNVTRATGAGMLLVFGGWLWRRRHRPRRPS